MDEIGSSNKAIESQPLRWGILGAARIARTSVAPAIRARGDVLRVIGASSLERAEAFARDCGVENAVEGYRVVLDRDDIDAVYLPLANDLHFRWALACAQAGKHCLCEKPMVLTADEARQLRDAFKRTGCELMEAFMWRHTTRTARIKQLVREGAIGRLRRIHVTTSFTLDRPPDNYRWSDDPGGGALWDLACYAVNAMRLYFKAEPVAVSARSHAIRPGGSADMSSVGWLDFGDDRLGTLECSYGSAYLQQMILIGTDGVLDVRYPFFGLPREASATLTVKDETQQLDFEPENAFERMLEHFGRAIHDRSLALWPGEDGAVQARAMEALATSAQSGGAPQDVMGL